MIVTPDNFDSVLEEIRKSHRISVDTETTGLRPYHGDMAFAVIVGTETDAYYFNFKFYDESTPVLPLKKRIEIYSAVKDKTIYFANAKFDMHFLNGWGLEYLPWDVLVVDKCIYNRHLTYNLDSVAKRMGIQGKDSDLMEYIKEHDLYDKEQVEGKKTVKRNPRFDKVPFPVISKYAMQDARITYQIGELQQEEVKKLSKKYSSIKGYPGNFYNLILDECKLTKVLFEIERTGMELDYEFLKKAKIREENRISEAKEKFTELTGKELVDSNKAIDEIFRANGIVGGTTAKGNASFTDAVLQTIDHPLAKIITEYRDAYKRLNTYYNSFTYYGDSQRVVRPNIKQTAADTFRFSITDPALQTLNSEDDGEFRVRDSFKARRDHLFVSIDYQAQEYRLTADYAGERELIRQINEGIDVHSATAKMMGVDRYSAKVLNFALLYGAAAPKIATMLKVSQEKAQVLKDLYFSKLSSVKSLIAGIKTKIDTRGFIFNFAGRVLHFPMIDFEKDGQMRRGNFAYKGPNYIIQSSGSEIMRKALLSIHEFLKPYRSRVVLTIHDEVLLEMIESELHLIPEIRTLMENSYIPKNGLPMKTSVAIGVTWGKLEDIDEDTLTKRIDLQKKGIKQTEKNSEHSGIYNQSDINQGNSGSASLC